MQAVTVSMGPAISQPASSRQAPFNQANFRMTSGTGHANTLKQKQGLSRMLWLCCDWLFFERALVDLSVLHAADQEGSGVGAKGLSA